MGNTYLGKLHYCNEKKIISLANTLAGRIFRARFLATDNGWYVETLDGDWWTLLHIAHTMQEALIELFGYANALNVPMCPKGWDQVVA